MNDKKFREEKKKLLQDCTVRVGDTCRLECCCREVRLGVTPCHIGDKLSGYNTLADQYEEWEVVEVNGKDPWRSRVKRTK